MAPEVVGHAAHAAHVAAVVIAAVAVPWGWAVAERGIGAADESEATERFVRLLAAFPAGDQLEDIGHGHSLFGARAACGTEVFVESHATIVSAAGARVKLAAADPLCRAELVDRAVRDAHHRTGLVRDDEYVQVDELVALAFEEVRDDSGAAKMIAGMRGREVLHLA